MDNTIMDAVFFITVLTIYFCSFSSLKIKNQKLSLFFLLLGGLLLRIYVSCDFFLHEWDERYHALVAKNMMANPFKPMLYVDPILDYNFQNWTSNHIWLHKQPFPLWTIAMSFHVFGINEIALRFPSVIYSTTALYLTFYLGKYFFNARIGLLAAFFHSINGLVVELTGGRVTTDHVDIFFLFFIELSIVLGVIYVNRKKWYYLPLAGMAVGAALLSKWLPALIVLPVLMLVYWQKEKITFWNAMKIVVPIALVAFLVAAPWQVYIHQEFPLEAEWESRYNWLHFTHELEGHGSGFFYHFDKMRIIWGELIYLPLLFFLWELFRKKNWEYSALAFWILFPYLFFSFAATKMQGYTLFVGPAIFIVLAWHCNALHAKNLYLNKKWLSKLILMLLVALPVRYCIERVKPFQRNTEKTEWTEAIKKLGDEYNSRKVVLFNQENPIETMFYTDFIVYNTIPEKSKLEELNLKGYTVLINKNGTNPLPDWLKSTKAIVIFI